MFKYVILKSSFSILQKDCLHKFLSEKYVWIIRLKCIWMFILLSNVSFNNVLNNPVFKEKRMIHWQLFILIIIIVIFIFLQCSIFYLLELISDFMLSSNSTCYNHPFIMLIYGRIIVKSLNSVFASTEIIVGKRLNRLIDRWYRQTDK